MFYRIIGILALLPIFSFAQDSKAISENRFYVQPEYFFAKGFAGPGVGAGYRFRERSYGGDLSVHAFPVAMCSSKGFWPFLKGAFLAYPSSRGFYVGGGANLGVLLGPLVTMGFESSKKDKLFVFAQLDGCFSFFSNQAVASAAFGFGF